MALLAVANVAISIPMLFTDTENVGVEGLTVTATARKAGTTTTVSGTVTERSDGDYDASITLTSVGTWFFKASTTIDGEPALWTETIEVVTAAQNDPAAALAAGTVTVVSPVALSGNVTVFQGDDQQAVDSRSLDWATTSAGQWPDLTGASIELQAKHRTNRSLTLVTAGSVVTPTGSTKAVRVELTAAQTEALKAGEYAIQVIATLANGHVSTLVAGTDDVPVTMTIVSRVVPA